MGGRKGGERKGGRESTNTCSTASARNTPRPSMLRENLINLGHTANTMVERHSNRPLDIATVTVNNLEKLEQPTVRKIKCRARKDKSSHGECVQVILCKGTEKCHFTI